MTEARRLLERASQRAATLTEEERNAYAVCLKYGFDVPASEVVTILESLAESRAREGELVAALERERDRWRAALTAFEGNDTVDIDYASALRAESELTRTLTALAQGKKA